MNGDSRYKGESIEEGCWSLEEEEEEPAEGESGSGTKERMAVIIILHVLAKWGNSQPEGNNSNSHMFIMHNHPSMKSWHCEWYYSYTYMVSTE